MKAITINTIEKAFSLPGTQSGDKFLKRFKYHLLWDVVPTVMILAIVGCGALMVTKSVHLAKTSHTVTLIESK